MRWAWLVLILSGCAEPLAAEFIEDSNSVRPSDDQPAASRVRGDFQFAAASPCPSVLTLDASSIGPTLPIGPPGGLAPTRRELSASIFMQREVFRDDVNLASVVTSEDARVQWSVDRGEIVGSSEGTIVRVRSPHDLGPFTLQVVVTDASGHAKRDEFTSTVVGGKWLKSPFAPHPRSQHTAVTLRNGRVLIAGGGPNGTAFVPTVVELFDPVTNTFAEIGEIPRHRKPAILELPDGRVMVTGGTTEFWDPLTRAWTAGPPTPYGAASGIVDDRGAVIVNFGGLLHQLDGDAWTPTSFMGGPALFLSAAGELVAVGGEVKWFDRRTGTSRTTPLPFVATGAALLDDGSIVAVRNDVVAHLKSGVLTTHPLILGSGASVVAIAGGRAALVGAGQTFLFDGTTATPVAQHVLGYDSASTRLLDGSVATFGGGAPSLSTTAGWGRVEVETQTWIPGLLRGGALGFGGPQHRPVRLRNGEVLLLVSAHFGEPRSLLHFDPRSNTWSRRTAPPQDLPGVMTSFDDSMLVAGVDPMLYDSRADRWISVASGFAIQADLAVTLTSGRALLVNRTQARLFDPASDRWFVVANPPASLDGAALTALANGEALLSGGRTADGSASLATWIWSPGSDSWREHWPLLSATAGHEVFEFSDGRLFVGGGSSTAQWLMPGEDLWVEQPGLESGFSAATRTAPLGELILHVNEPPLCQCLSARGTRVLDPTTGAVRVTYDAAGRSGARLTVVGDGRVMLTGGIGRSAGAVEFFKE